jgi:hypothetical protein
MSQLAATLTSELAGRFRLIGKTGDAVQIVLPATEEALAAELVDRYRDSVQVTVGALPYPMPSDASSVCTQLDATQTDAALDTVIVAPTEAFVASGVEPWNFEIQISNVGDAPIEFVTGIAGGIVLDSNGDVVGTPTVEVPDGGIGVDLAPGESTVVPGVFDSASCEPRLGYTLPPGQYDLVALVQRSDDTGSRRILTARQPIVIGA